MLETDAILTSADVLRELLDELGEPLVRLLLVRFEARLDVDVAGIEDGLDLGLGLGLGLSLEILLCILNILWKPLGARAND